MNTILIRVEGDRADRILALNGLNDPLTARIGTREGDGPYLTYDGNTVLGVYALESCGVWSESLVLLNELYSNAKNKEEKNATTGG